MLADHLVRWHANVYYQSNFFLPVQSTEVCKCITFDVKIKIPLFEYSHFYYFYIMENNCDDKLYSVFYCWVHCGIFVLAMSSWHTKWTYFTFGTLIKWFFHTIYHGWPSLLLLWDISLSHRHKFVILICLSFGSIPSNLRISNSNYTSWFLQPMESGFFVCFKLFKAVFLPLAPKVTSPLFHMVRWMLDASINATLIIAPWGAV